MKKSIFHTYYYYLKHGLSISINLFYYNFMFKLRDELKFSFKK